MSEQDGDLVGWDSELDDVDLCCSSPSSSASTVEDTSREHAGVSSARLRPSDFASAASTSAAQSAASGKSSQSQRQSTCAAANAVASRSSSLSSMRPSPSRVSPKPGGPLFSLAVSDLSSCNTGSSSGVDRTPSFKQLGKPHLQEAAAAAAAPQDAAGKLCKQQLQEKQECVLPALQASAQPQIKPSATKIRSLNLRLSADSHGTASDSSDRVNYWHTAATGSDVAAIAAAAAIAGLKPPSPSALACHSNSSAPQGTQQSSTSRRSGIRRASPGSLHVHRAGVGGMAQQSSGRGNKPPPLSLFSSSTTSPRGSPHGYAHTDVGAIGGAAGWAGVRSAAEHGRVLGSQAALQAEPQQLVKVQLLLPALEVYLPMQTGDAAAGAAADGSGSSSSSIGDRGSSQQNLTKLVGSRDGSSGGLLRQSNSGGSSSAAAAGGRSTSISRGRSSLEGSLMAAAAYPAVEGEGQGGPSNHALYQHADDGSVAAAEMLQNAISRALGVDTSQLAYYAMQHMQLSEMLQKQQQLSQPAYNQARAQASISSAGVAADGGSRPPSRGLSPVRGSSASSSTTWPASKLPLPEQQQPWTVVVGFPEGSCEFSLARLEEILQCASAAKDDPASLQEPTKQLQEDLVRAKTRSMELAGDLARLQRAHHQVSQELNSTKLALLEAQSELAVAGDSFVKLEALHRGANATKGRRSQSNSPRKQQSSSSRGPPSARSHDQQQQQQQNPLMKFAAAAAATAAAVAAEQPAQPPHPPPAATAALAALTTSAGGRATGGSSLDYNDLVALMSRVASPGFLNFMQQFLLLYEQQSCCSAADLAAVAAAMAGNAATGASSFPMSAVPTPGAGRSSSSGRSRTPRQHLDRSTAGNGSASTLAGPYVVKHQQERQPQRFLSSDALGAESADITVTTTVDVNGGSSSGRRTGRRKGIGGRPL